MYIVMQRRPHTKILFASNSYDATINFFELQLHHGIGWFELLQRNNNKPLRSGGKEQASVHHQQKDNNVRRMTPSMYQDTAENNLLTRLFANHY
jgi:hypothetical protein